MKPRTLLELARLSEDQARGYLESVRWPDGAICPHCESDKTGKLKGVKDKKGRVRQGLYKCYACRKQFTVTTGTVMHRSHLSIRQWIIGFYLVASGKKGIAALELQRVLGIGGNKCAWHMLHRIREAMKGEPLADKLTGIVESDETWIGGKMRVRKTKGKFHTSGGTYPMENKTPVIAMIQRDGQAVSMPVPDVRQDTLSATLLSHVDIKAVLNTDTYMPYIGIGKRFRSHMQVNHTQGEYARGSAHVNTAESYFALMKRGVHGVYHHVSVKHLARYCTEYAFRWNHRRLSDIERAKRMMLQSGGRTLEYKRLIDEKRKET